MTTTETEEQPVLKLVKTPPISLQCVKRSRNIERKIYNHFEVHMRAFTLGCRELNMMRTLNAMKKMARSLPSVERKMTVILTTT